LREMAMLGDVGPNEILFIGEGINDLEVVYRDWSNPRAIFCFQERGAADICVKTAALNARLRPGNIPLGAGAVNSMIERRGIERDIIRLGNGFIDLLDLIDRGQISFVAPRRVPVVRNGRLELGPTLAGGAGNCADSLHGDDRIRRTLTGADGSEQPTATAADWAARAGAAPAAVPRSPCG
jgi:hypothetical protein